MKTLSCILAAAALASAAFAFAAPQRYGYGYDTSTAIQEMRDSIDDLRHEMTNRESEIRTFEEKVANQENIIESLRDQLTNTTKAQQDLVKGNSNNLEMKINSLETTVKGLVADLKQLKNYSNDTAQSIAQTKQKITQLEKIVEAQNQNVDNLQAAMRSLMDALDLKGSVDKVAADSPMKSYRVKAGDSLEKIARIHQTTIKAIKELNGLNNDKIVVGQNLKIP